MESRHGTSFISLEDARSKLAIPTQAEFTTSEIELSGKNPESLARHEDSAHILMMGITPKEMSELYGGVAFKFEQLEAEFTKICPDYANALAWEAKNLALDFASKMIFIIGPESRAVKKPGTDKKWKFRFITKESEKSYHINTVFVCTFKNTTPPEPQPKVDGNKLILTIKQASLLALTTLAKVVGLCVDKDSIIMTPLAGAIFSKQDLEKLAKEVHGDCYTNVNMAQLICAIMQSCQSGGHHLKYSKCHIAIVASICATKNMKDKRLRDTIISKTYKQYVASGKDMDREKFIIYAKYATGGVPVEYMPEKLIELYDSAQLTGLKAAKEAAATVVSKN